MLTVIGQILPLMLVAALSPIYIVAILAILTTPNGKSNGTAYVLGWLLGQGAVALLMGFIGVGVEAAEDANPSIGQIIVSLLPIVLGAFFLFMAYRTWKSRPAKGDTPKLPSWMAALDKLTPRTSVLAGMATASIANTKNLALSVSVAGIIAAAELNIAETAVAWLLFTLATASLVALPWLMMIFAPDRAVRVLGGAREWMVANITAIQLVLFSVLGALFIGKGIGAL